MEIKFAKSDNVGVPATTVAGILHDLCQPLTALECSLELALLPCPPAEARSFTSAALQAVRRLHIIANHAQAIERLCGQYRHPRVLSLGELATIFGFAPPALLARAPRFRQGEVLFAGGFLRGQEVDRPPARKQPLRRVD